MNAGGLPARAHAEVLALYDPDRLRAPLHNLPNAKRTNRETISAKLEELDAEVVASLGKGPVAILTGSAPSPSLLAMISDFLKTYPGRHVQWDAVPMDDVREAARRSYGRASVPRYRFDQAKTIVSIDGDFLGTYLSTAEQMRQWSTARKPGPNMARLVSFESILSLTGMNADDRYRIRATQQLDVVLGLLYQVGVKLAKHPYATSGKAAEFLAGYASVAERLGLDSAAFAKVAEELWQNRGKGIVIAGGLPTQTADGIDLQVAVNMLNAILGNEGATIDRETSPAMAYQSSSAELQALLADMAAGKVTTLIVHGVNPAHALPSEAGFAEAAAKTPLIVYSGNYNDETGRLSNFVLPPGSPMEAWGDYELQLGVYSIQQPTIRPLYETRSLGESLHAWALKGKSPAARVAGSASWYEYVRGAWKADLYPKAAAEAKGGSFEEFWAGLLQRGVFDTTSGRRSRGAASVVAFKADALGTKAPSASNGYELALYPKVGIGDGRYANIPWMQELPDPITKIVWDNYLSVSPATAAKEKLRHGEVVDLAVGGKTARVPVAIQPGLHDAVFALAIGYGREGAGKVASGLGVNGAQLASWVGGRLVASGLPATIKKVGERYDLVSTQGHHQLRDAKWEAKDRPIVAEATLAEYQKNPSAGIEREKIFSIWPEHAYSKHKWAMSIDLNTCTGCSACVIACQSENNVPTVGKKYVMQGREMHWIRIDRYYKGSASDPEVVFQPMLCQQCENAPCETVCPVVATVHNEEGLNDMVYNRCVGTRYCSNNCPYKVRRFNWFNYSKRPEPTHMALNPDVTVRSRGVMEKCTFCVQRIRKGTNAARDRGERVRDAEVAPACAESCPTNAIAFGDLNDASSLVAKLFKDERSFAVLEELNTQPRVRYATRIRNAERAGEESPLKESHPGEPAAPGRLKTHSKEGGHA
jgi:molybdopterin-containing oxidoreductase family iron-sulfur binding subunit